MSSIHAEYLWNRGEPAGRSPLGVCVEGKCGAELQICGVDPEELLANLERACGHWCEQNFGPYTPDCPNYLPCGAYRLAEGYDPGPDAIVAVRHIECDSVNAGVGCSPLASGGAGGGPIDVTLTWPTDPLDVTLTWPTEPLTVTGTVGVTAACGDLAVDLCPLPPDFPPIPVTIVTDPTPQAPDFEYTCAADDGRVIISVTTVDPTTGAVTTELLEADGVTPVPAGTLAGACAEPVSYAPTAPKKICVEDAEGNVVEGYCVNTLVNPSDTTDTISVYIDPDGAVVDPATLTIVPCPEDAGSCPNLMVIPDITVTGAGSAEVIPANTYGYFCVHVPCEKRTFNAATCSFDYVPVPENTIVSIDYGNGQVEHIGPGESCCRDARGICPCSCLPRTIDHEITVTVECGDAGACAIISGDI